MIIHLSMEITHELVIAELDYDSFFFQAEDGIRDLVRSRGLGDVYKRQAQRVVGYPLARCFASRGPPPDRTLPGSGAPTRSPTDRYDASGAPPVRFEAMPA